MLNISRCTAFSVHTARKISSGFLNLFILTVAVLLLAPVQAALAASGRITVDLTYAAAGLGYQTGSATVTLDGKVAHYKIKGFQFLGGGVSNFSGKGTVTGARTLDDLNGDFTVTRGSLSAIVGGVTLSLHNARGVKIELSGRTTGVDASIGPGKLTFTRLGAIRNTVAKSRARSASGGGSPGARIGGGMEGMHAQHAPKAGVGFMPGLDKGLPRIGLYAYTMRHARVANPPDLLGGPLRVSLVKKNTSTRWVLPGPRFLDPAIFGTPAHPVGWEQAPFPLIGMQPSWRRSEGGKYTIVDHATPFSNWMEIGVGSVHMKLVDATAIDGARTKDKVDFEATFKSPDGKHSYRVVCKKALPHGKGYPFFGGVVTNHLLHGGTAIGTRLMPTEFTYAGFWGVGKIYRDGKLANDGQIIHVMVGEFVRGDDQKLQFDGGVDPHGMTMHLMVPPYRVSPKGPVLAPVKTAYAPFPLIKKHMMAEMKRLKETKNLSPAQKKAKMKRMMEIKALMAHTKEKMVQAMMQGNQFLGQPFLHVMFGMRASDLQVSR